MYNQLRDYTHALEDAETAIKLDPKDSEAYQNAGLANTYIGDFAQAINYFNQAIDLKPTYVLAYHNRGAAYAAK
ncbi:MAG: tetratricopeptide repeat protein [Chloroflexia bacterium]